MAACRGPPIDYRLFRILIGVETKADGLSFDDILGLVGGLVDPLADGFDSRWRQQRVPPEHLYAPDGAAGRDGNFQDDNTRESSFTGTRWVDWWHSSCQFDAFDRNA